MTTADDDALLAELGAAVAAAGAVPESVVRAGRAAWAWRTADAELAALTADTATDGLAVAVRGPADDARWLAFAVDDLTIEIELAPDALRGRLDPPRSAPVGVLPTTGTPSSVTADENGYFVVTPPPKPPFRLLVDLGERRIGTPVID